MSEQHNWREMPAGPELDEMICRIRGWSVTTNPLQNSATLWDPDQNIVNTWGSSQAWPNVVNIAWYNAPRFTRSLDDAMTLFTDLPDDCTPRLVRLLQAAGDHIEHIWKAGIIIDDHSFPIDNIECEAETPALAICRAWLSWHEEDR